ncbi:NAD-dependent epimerase/dehydratase family protein [Candidatus Micrarchaeota archaeon]|nr:NAD-dependent epimerase/dehydratase family protein [Candidatus Micrarchaeota archaeon]
MAGNKVFVTGATGRLGRAVMAMLPDAIPLVREPGGLKDEVVTDFSTDQLKIILIGAKVVVHLAGSVDTTDKKALHDSNVSLTWRLVDALPKGCRIVFASSVSVYGKKLASMPANEGTEAHPDSDYARSKYQAEKIVEKWPDHVILRVSTIYGPQFDDYAKVIDMIRKGRMRSIGKGTNRIPFVHVDDVAAAVVAAVGRGKGTYVIAGEPLAQKDIYRIAAQDLGVEPPKKSVQLPLAMFMAVAGEAIYKLTKKGKPVLTAEHVSILGYDRVFDCSRARSDLGFSPRPLADGIRAMVAVLAKAK